MAIKWLRAWETGVKEIDDQHKKLVEIINKLLKAQFEHKENAVLREVMIELVEYTKVHFSSEENFYEKHRFDGLQEHKAQHRVLVNQIVHILEEMRDGKFEVHNELTAVLKNWLIKHVLNYDIRAVKDILDQ